MPSVSLSTTPFEYSRSLVERYNSTLDIDEYRTQQYTYSSAGLNISQILPFSGGSLSLTSNLSRLNYYGISNYTQFTSIPAIISLSQPILGFNSYKWQLKTAPILYEKAERDYVQSVETIAIQLVGYYFDLLTAQLKLKAAVINLANADTFYSIGTKRRELGSLTLVDVQNLKVAELNAKNEFAEAQKELKIAELAFNSFLRIDEHSIVELEIPEKIIPGKISCDTAFQIGEENNPLLLGYKEQLIESASDLEQTKRSSLLNSTLTLSYGLNQQSSTLPGSYHNPMDKQQASIDFSMPILGWGQRREKINIARKNFENSQISIQQAIINFRQQLITTVINCNMQKDIIISAVETKEAAQMAFDLTKQLFIIGKADIYSLNIAQKQLQLSRLACIDAYRNYWTYYYTLRQLTLFDFDKNLPLSVDFEKIIESDNYIKLF